MQLHLRLNGDNSNTSMQGSWVKKRFLQCGLRWSSVVVSAGLVLVFPKVSAAQPTEAIVPPRMVTSVMPTYPSNGNGVSADVDLVITVNDHGRVVQVERDPRSTETVGESFIAAAIAAASALEFTPARRGERAIAVRIGYRMHFAPPQVALSTEPVVTPTTTATERERESNREQDRDANTDPGTTVRTQRGPESRGAGDIVTRIGPLGQVPNSNSSALLRLAAPGVLLTNEGGDGHAERVFLRGFDAREGQDLEFTVQGIPINEVGNPHGEGYSDTHFIIPELVRSIRVLEGPFDPHQGNYAVAGSAEYRLGVDSRGLMVRYEGGSFNTHRALAVFRPGGFSPGTFIGADLRTTDGFGANRAARLGRAMAQFEARLGPTTTFRLLGQAYATRFGSAGVVREDDVNRGTVDFYGTYDATQGGDVARYGAGAWLEDVTPNRRLEQSLFATVRQLRIRSNFTGFLEDPPAPFRSGIAQRGDMVDQNYQAFTVGARGAARLSAQWRGQTQAIEAGYYARYDYADASQQRLRFGTVIPYRIDSSLGLSVANIGVYIDAEFKPWRWLTLRGGLRGDFFLFDVLNRCDLHDTTLNSATPVVDVLCYERDRVGPRAPNARRSASGIIMQPRATLQVGPFTGVSFTGSIGTGARAADPSYLGDGNQSPFATAFAVEGGVVFNRDFGPAQLTVRGLYYYTAVGRDLIFNQQAGRNTLAPGTRRQGALFAWRLSGDWFDWAASVTYANARFEREVNDPGNTYFPADTGDRVPFIPDWVVRSDAAFFGDLPWPVIAGSAVTARAAVGVSYISPRALLYGERGEVIFLADASASLRWRFVEVGVVAQNLFNNQYRLGEYNYPSEFRQGTSTPNLLAVRHFTAGAPLSVLGTLTVYIGDSSPNASSAR